jgi:hypothetical protein
VPTNCDPCGNSAPCANPAATRQPGCSGMGGTPQAPRQENVCSDCKAPPVTQPDETRPAPQLPPQPPQPPIPLPEPDSCIGCDTTSPDNRARPGESKPH